MHKFYQFYENVKWNLDSALFKSQISWSTIATVINIIHDPFPSQHFLPVRYYILTFTKFIFGFIQQWNITVRMDAVLGWVKLVNIVDSTRNWQMNVSFSGQIMWLLMCIKIVFKGKSNINKIAIHYKVI